MSCRWCHDRPGGCLYCVGEAAGDPEDGLRELQARIESGELEIVEVQVVRAEQQALLVRRNCWRATRPRPAGPCRAHRWAFDPQDFQRRYCVNAGCSARQRWVLLPEDPRRNGEWRDESEANHGPLPAPTRRKRTKAVAMAVD